MASRRKRKRTIIKWGPVLWLLLVVNVAAGLIYSNITSVVRARVDGAKVHDQERIAKILAGLKDIPVSKVDARMLESKVMELPEVRTAELSRTPFGTALLKVRYRRPVARVRNTNTLALTVDGVLYPATDVPEDVPVLSLPGGTPRVLGTIAAPWRPVAIASLAVQARERWPQEQLSIDVDDRGSVCLNIGTGRVVLGAPADLDKKLEVLSERLERNPTELQTVAELNLTAPENPSIIRRTSQQP